MEEKGKRNGETETKTENETLKLEKWSCDSCTNIFSSNMIHPMLAYLSEAPLKGLLLGRVLALLTNIRLGWKGLPGSNTLGNMCKLQP